jgi:hypothetical protein
MKYIVGILISLVIIGITINSIVEKRQPYQVVIQDIWVLDESVSAHWLEYLKDKDKVNIDDAHFYIYDSRDRYVEKTKYLRQKYYDDTK